MDLIELRIGLIMNRFRLGVTLQKDRVHLLALNTGQSQRLGELLRTRRSPRRLRQGHVRGRHQMMAIRIAQGSAQRGTEEEHSMSEHAGLRRGGVWVDVVFSCTGTSR